MTNNEFIANEPEKLLVVGVSDREHTDIDVSLDELEELIKTAGGISVGRVIQNLEQINNVTYVGKGKLLEIKDLLFETEAVGIVCDDELSPVQLRTLEEELQVKVMDRTLIILDIFAQRAQTAEGKLQVELAQLKYRLSRLTGLGKSLSRLGGGIGTRGPGEKKLEMDRRLIKDRIAHLNRELKDVERHREVTRSRRTKNNMLNVAIVGYTNAGKSTLLNTLTGASVLEEDKLFATLDPVTRILDITKNKQVLLTDTVGFIRKLPHNLIDAFKSTLEESKYADVILHVVDVSDSDYATHMHVVYDTLDKLGVSGKPVITAFNKTDVYLEDELPRDIKADKNVYISAKTGNNLDTLVAAIDEVTNFGKVILERVFPYTEAGLLSSLRKDGEILEEDYRDNGIYVKAMVKGEYYKRYI